MDTQIPFKGGLARTATYIVALCLLAIATPLAADEGPLQLSFADRDGIDTRSFRFSRERLGGFERKKLSKDFKVRGWEVAENVYFGQAKVAKKWGLGIVYERGNTVFGLNNRGIQVMKRF